MNETQAETVAEALGGDIWNSGGEMYLVILRRKSFTVIAIYLPDHGAGYLHINQFAKSCL
jgi:hypothetical protein